MLPVIDEGMIDKLKTLRSFVPAITHVDYSARIQTVDRQRHGIYHRLLAAFERKTGCPCLLLKNDKKWNDFHCILEASAKDSASMYMAKVLAESQS